ncbi:MAG: ribosome biogenesis GTPase YlqF [Eubacteriales bacterium]|nr:ribosome biogenesis GTPase YlqF [Eubacteriales bacterium]MDD4327248.1 ribosome biogenesis GTPase YlqF [Eubacteriales bacterium]MDD4716885.1 ribosome biogenesis GTPase YlqF [Eubacteriales bacterium]NCU26908.1 ribosome biogenesis GTPase YlqF [Candidatus Nomurabacteria bacterium]
MEVQWFPGHMAKALRDVKERLKLVDMVIEVCDARIPASSRNPVLDEILGLKPRLILLNKSDLADGTITDKWIESFGSAGINSMASEGTDRNSARKTISACLSICSDKLERAKERGQLVRPVRAMVVGIPNSGKSSIINSISARKAAITSDKPGVTRSPQWIRAGNEMELMDMPGVLWPKIGTIEGQILLAAIGSVKDSVIDVVEVAFASMRIVARLYPELLETRYKIHVEKDITAEDFEKAALLRGCVRSGGKADLERFSNIFLDELRAGKAGRMTFERP